MVRTCKAETAVDTCLCIIEYTWDEDQPVASRSINHYINQRVCSAHQSLALKQATTFSGEEITKKKQDKLSLLKGMLDNNEQRNIGEIMKMHAQLNSDGTKPRFLKQKIKDDNLGVEAEEYVELPSIDRIKTQLDEHRNSKMEFYETLMREPKSLSIDVYNTVLEENRRKNIALQVALTNGPVGLYNIHTDGTRLLKETITYVWSWTGTAPNRVLRISFTGITLTSAQKTTIQNAENTRFGTGKVTVL
jgi:hypothetical protein